MGDEPEATFVVHNEEEEATILLASRLGPLLSAGDLLILSGGLGAGKTFFTRALCHALGLPEDEPVTSPTFTLAHEYMTEPPVVHADLYRLTDEDEVYELGLESKRLDGQLLVVEWGAPFEGVLGGGALFVDLAIEPRRATLRGGATRPRQIVAALRESYTKFGAPREKVDDASTKGEASESSEGGESA